jgi:hypothetical protein
MIFYHIIYLQSIKKKILEFDKYLYHATTERKWPYN